ncbi:TPA: hypothetical protein ACH90R_003593, partial [Escherichia coli]
ADRNRSHWSTSKTPSYTKSVSWQHHPKTEIFPSFPTFIFVYNIIEVICISQKYSQDMIAMTPA